MRNGALFNRPATVVKLLVIKQLVLLPGEGYPDKTGFMAMRRESGNPAAAGSMFGGAYLTGRQRATAHLRMVHLPML